MSKFRYINTKFWSDNFIIELDYTERYLFLYLLTNEHTNISGIYELPLRMIEFETGMKIEMIKSIIERFSKQNKVYYVDGWIFIVNFTKHQNINSSKIRTGIKREFDNIPAEITKKLYDIYMVSIQYEYHIIYLIKSNIIKSNIIEEPPQKQKAVKKHSFIDELISIFEECYLNNKSSPYIIKKQDSKHIGMMLNSLKKLYPEKNTDEMRDLMKVLFDKATQINTPEFLATITISKLNSNINEYINHIKNKLGTSRNNTRFTGIDNDKYNRVLQILSN